MSDVCETGLIPLVSARLYRIFNSKNAPEPE